MQQHGGLLALMKQTVIANDLLRGTMSTVSEKRLDSRTTDNRHVLAVSRRISVGLGLSVIAAIHILDLPGKIQETPYIAGLYIALIVACFVVMERLFVVGSRRNFVAAVALSAIVIVGFVVNRTVGMPLAMGDIGNWLEPLGLISLVAEGFVLWQALAAVAGFERTAR